MSLSHIKKSCCKVNIIPRGSDLGGFCFGGFGLNEIVFWVGLGYGLGLCFGWFGPRILKDLQYFLKDSQWIWNPLRILQDFYQFFFKLICGFYKICHSFLN